jgi:hypothetical protein
LLFSVCPCPPLSIKCAQDELRTRERVERQVGLELEGAQSELARLAARLQVCVCVLGAIADKANAVCSCGLDDAHPA